ncbi:hypothetical protein [Burkholderia phage BCSR5]|nr:hypothetical protein [Burkholderia phage BCSR5]
MSPWTKFLLGVLAFNALAAVAYGIRVEYKARKRMIEDIRARKKVIEIWRDHE